MLGRGGLKGTKGRESGHPGRPIDSPGSTPQNDDVVIRREILVEEEELACFVFCSFPVFRKVEVSRRKHNTNNLTSLDVLLSVLSSKTNGRKPDD